MFETAAEAVAGASEPVASSFVSGMAFTATLEESGRGGHWVVVPFDARDVFGQARPPVRGTVNGTPIRGRLAV